MRTLGLIFVFLGLLVLFQQFHPAFIGPLYQYAPYIKRAFWGVTFTLLGLYMLTRGALRRLILAVYLIYLLIYLVV